METKKEKDGGAMSDFCEDIGRGTIEPKVHTIEVYKNFLCECGASDWNIFEAQHKFSMVCKSCNFKLFIGFPTFERKCAREEGRVAGAREELEESIKWFKEAKKEMTSKIELLKANRNNKSDELISFAYGVINAFREDYENIIKEKEKRLSELGAGK